jgi:opacity protein-like surface antigen
MLTSRLMAAGVVLGSLTVPAAALAQEPGDIGVTMGYPGGIGIVYHVSDRVAIRPEITFSATSGDSESSLSTTESDSTAVGIGGSVLFYLKEWDKLQSYFAPRYTYTHASTSSTSTPQLPAIGAIESTTTTNAHAFVGTFGAQYALHERFSVFGEVGAGYTHQRATSDISGIESTTSQFTTRTGVGVIFYF